MGQIPIRHPNDNSRHPNDNSAEEFVIKWVTRNKVKLMRKVLVVYKHNYSFSMGTHLAGGFDAS
ncbi:MAG: hypothetical protein HN580_17755 [Deltaproteobacteria bacterium]|nr:hypothetical protein [Deltaproteobacteria bacterium]MBT4644759.1 hypothetical protein [Deltaproteobacteria bacterium]MBT6614817.1 hypothetical protein [Deltaproteobacteria bacterium]MBT7890867.1 hypothetical protein [Deltaproteobacteria bacterium]